MFAYAPTLGYCKVYNHAGFMPIYVNSLVNELKKEKKST